MTVTRPALAQEDGGGEGPRFTYGVEFSATVGPEDDGFFNYTDYEYSLLRLVTGTFVGSLRINDHVEVLGEARVQNDQFSTSALYVRVRPWRDGPLAIQAGRIPPTFGRFGRQAYSRANAVIGLPLAYQYLTTLRSTEVPVGTDALLAVRGRGWLVGYPGALTGDGAAEAEAGLPLVAATRRDTGVQLNASSQRFDASVAFTNGSLSNPRVRDDNGGKQIAARVTWRPFAALDVGASVARGAFLARSVTSVLPVGTPWHDYVQVAEGVDAEVSAAHWVLRGEIVRSSWRLPALGTPALEPLEANAMTAEFAYRLGPRWRPAIRTEHLTFSDLPSTARGRLSWDAPVSRVEIALGYTISRHVEAKAAWQYNRRDSVSRPQPREGFLAVQVTAWY